MPPSPLWLSSEYLCILRWGGALLSPLPNLPLDTPTLSLPHVSLSSPWSAVPLYGGMLSGPTSSTLSPPNSRFHRVTLTAPPTCKLPPRTALFIFYFLGYHPCIQCHLEPVYFRFDITKLTPCQRHFFWGGRGSYDLYITLHLTK